MSVCSKDAAAPFDLVELVDGFAAPEASPVSALSRCTIRRLAAKPYLQFELDFPAAGGELTVHHDGRLVDRAELTGGWQHSAVELKDVPALAELNVEFRDAAGALVDGVTVRAIFLSDSWGRGQRKRLKCHMPFTLAAVFQDFSVYPCCARQWMNGHQAAGNSKTEAVGEIWNGAYYQDMRANFLKGNYGATCREDVCPVLSGEGKVSEPSAKVIQAVNEGQTVLPYGPTHMYHDIDRGCNLECVMCRDAKVLPNESNINQALGDIRSVLDLGSLEELWISGAGEALGMKKVVQLLETDDFSSKGISLSFTTNLTYFNDKLWRRIGHNKFKNIVVSADGCSPEIYNAIRIGADWDTIAGNMNFLAAARREGKIEHISWNYTVMRQNIKDVGKAVRLAWEIGFDSIRFIAQLGQLRRTGGNMFEDYDLNALDALYDELEGAGAFDDPRVIMSEVAMRGRHYRSPEFRLELAEHIFQRRAYSSGASLLSSTDWSKCTRLIKTVADDCKTGKISNPATMSERNIRFLESFRHGSPGLIASLRSFRRLPVRRALGNVLDAYRTGKWVRDLAASARPEPAPVDQARGSETAVRSSAP